jgi:hypothetical protein
MKLLDAARQRPAVWAALVLAVVASGYFGFHALFVKVSRTVEMPFSGPARYDNYYVLGRYLQERGLHVEATRSWPQPLTDDTALLWFTDEELPRDVRSWLASGGRLWSFNDPDSEEDAWDGLNTYWDATDGGLADEGLADGGVVDGGRVDAGAGSSAVADASVDAGADADEALADYDAYFDEGCGDDGCLYAAQFEYGAGCFTLVGAYGLWNEQVQLGETPARIDALLRCASHVPQPPRRVVIVSSANSPWFGSLLIEHAPEALLGAAACLLVWLWRASRRFGPVLAPRDRARRRVLDHVAAVGRLALRVGPETLIESARRELRQRVLRRVPGGRELEGAALVAAAVQTSGQSEAEVTRALLEPPSRAPSQLLAIARSIVALWRTS